MNLQEARDFCTRAHGQQTYGSYPYSFHLALVERVAMHFGFAGDTSILKAIWGHDVLEDTATTQGDLLAAGFTAYEIGLIFAVTDGEGSTRHEKKLAVYAKICDMPDSIIVKLCDRLANLIMNLVDGENRKYNRYRIEQADFEKACSQCLQDDPRVARLWQHVRYLLSEDGESKLSSTSIEACLAASA